VVELDEPVELLVGGSIFDDCINNGVYYIKASANG